MRAYKFGVPLLAGLLWIGCNKRPQFSYEVQQDISTEHYGDIALDPRTELIFGDSDRRSVDAPELREMVLEELRSKGFRIVPAEKAKLWLQIITLAEKQQPSLGSGESMGGAERSGGRSGRPGGGHGGGMGGPGGGGMGGPGGGSSRPGPQGPSTLVVAFLDPAHAEVLWKGIAELRMEGPPKPGSNHPVFFVKRLLEPLAISH
jgi:hypothetical protein